MDGIINVTATANRTNPIRAERKGKLGIVLSKLDRPVKRCDGKRVSYQIETIILSTEQDNELACVKYNEFDYFSKKELGKFFNRKLNLFDFITF